MDKIIDRIRKEILGADLSEQERKKLLELFENLQPELELLAKEQKDAALHIATHTEELSRAATREGGADPEQLRTSAGNLREAIGEFEVTHPQLVKIVNSISMMLSNVGI